MHAPACMLKTSLASSFICMHSCVHLLWMNSGHCYKQDGASRICRFTHIDYPAQHTQAVASSCSRRKIEVYLAAYFPTCFKPHASHSLYMHFMCQLLHHCVNASLLLYMHSWHVRKERKMSSFGEVKVQSQEGKDTLWPVSRNDM
jgi:hypothetical protein